MSAAAAGPPQHHLISKDLKRQQLETFVVKKASNVNCRFKGTELANALLRSEPGELAVVRP